jgi:hypothetical protein
MLRRGFGCRFTFGIERLAVEPLGRKGDAELFRFLLAAARYEPGAEGAA